MRRGTSDARVSGSDCLVNSLIKEVLFPHTLFGCGLRGAGGGKVVERRYLSFSLQVARGLLCEWGQLECNLALEPLEASLLHNRMNDRRLLCQDWP